MRRSGDGCLRAWAGLWLAGLLAVHGVGLGAPNVNAEEVFGRVKPAVIQVRIIDIATKTPSSVGSGFFVADDGAAVTNYHVVAQVVLEPKRYRAEFVAADGRVGPLQLIDVDVINDLALVRANIKPQATLHWSQRTTQKGERLFAVGNPRDLGMTIVEGTYSGVLEDSLYRRVHFTGTLNQGMSGGPTVNSDSEVVGVNVATAGNQISFLVLNQYAQALTKRGAPARAETGSELDLTASMDALRAEITRQLHVDQAAKLKRILARPLKTMQLGKYQVPGKFSPYLKCWGDSLSDPKLRYEMYSQQCSVEEYVYISEQHYSTLMVFRNDYFIGEKLNIIAFYRLLASRYAAPTIDVYSGSEQDLTQFACTSDFVKNGQINMRVSMCLRGFKKYKGIYDVVLIGATVVPEKYGLVTSIKLGGVSYENALLFAKNYFEALSWAP